MPNQVIFHELKRPNASIPWAHEYIISNKDVELNTVLYQFNLLQEYASGNNGWTREYVYTDDPNLMYVKCTYFGATSESVNHRALLHFKQIAANVAEWTQWKNNYQKMYGITKSKIDAHNRPDNSILNYGDYGRVETFGLKFQTHA
jgi:hypothetical protein